MKKQNYHLMNEYTNETIFQGWFVSIKQCVEQAVMDGVCLDGVNLSGANLACVNMDDAQMMGANCRNANFSGANMSEAVFDDTDFTGCDLTNVCFAVSSLTNVNFTEASFDGADITDAVVRHCQFSCPSVFNIPWRRTAAFSDCTYVDHEYGVIKISRPPIFIQGLPRNIVFLDDGVRIGQHYIIKSAIRDAGISRLEYRYGREIAMHVYPALEIKENGFSVKNTLQESMSVL